MALNERMRYALYEAVREALGDDPADTLMEMLPPVGWADVATKQDIAAVRQEIAALRVDTLSRADLHAEINKLILWFVPLNIGLVLAVARLS